MKRDIHIKPFDEGTKVKLLLFREYIRNWLPVFLKKQSPFTRTINIFDFFAGPGKTEHGDLGSPLIVIEEIRAYLNQIKAQGFEINLYFNEYDKDKFAVLSANIPALEYCKLEVDNLDFSEAFEKVIPRVKGAANLLLLDQGGVKQINESVLKKIITLERTDFIMFISSSTLRRFADHPSIRKYLAVCTEELSAREYVDTHRYVTEYYRTLVTKDRKYYVAHFSIRKGSNIYGLIFGSGHLKGLEQFLAACWKVDPERGEANFDIDDDRIDRSAPYLFKQMNTPKKISLFEHELRRELEGGALRSKAEIREYALMSGFLSKHTTKVRREFEKNAKLKLR